ncbi:uncharacterized protein MYCFIDRAFT_195882 [Pseudocercospora fijiensis CIRAD86]|uniref:Uncharacterized protein n=1 Tax=Pseudocercospora fijiensis (strain CIRAD86) TaxID=383855 RepID=M3AK74_PSEFD|nr:uncharacterized protein MYCFIDRAFT_195882 [Pseudocercospora fijiensis CIRAD86]EME84981.1 hypothetical protein MYCFIDRAFT_195882 [Pseudocercospora fijiensis CIRAD86]
MPPFVEPLQQTRKGFLEDLGKHVLTFDLEGSEQECHICRETFLDYGGSAEDGSERAVVIHDKHVLGEKCARIWFTGINNCTHCRTILFPKSRPSDKELPGQTPFDENAYEEEHNDQEQDDTARLSDRVLLLRLRKNIKSHLGNLDAFNDMALDHLLDTFGSNNGNARFRSLINALDFRSSRYISGETVDDVDYLHYSRRFYRQERSEVCYTIRAANFNSKIWHWFVTSLSVRKATRRTQAFKIQDHAFVPKLVFEIFEVIRELDGSVVSISEFVKILTRRFGELGMPDCWQTESLKNYRDDLVSVVVTVVKGEQVVEDRAGMGGVVGSWMDGVEVANLQVALW